MRKAMTVKGIVSAFALTADEAAALNKSVLLYAVYRRVDYDGTAFVLFALRGKLYEVNGSHCSCYGLEGQWKPEENDAKALLARPNVPKVAKERIRTWMMGAK